MSDIYSASQQHLNLNFKETSPDHLKPGRYWFYLKKAGPAATLGFQGGAVYAGRDG
jgi:hypothetical protein